MEVHLARARERCAQGGKRYAAIRLGLGGGAIDEERYRVRIGAGETELNTVCGCGEGDEGPEGFAVYRDGAPAPADLRDGHPGWLLSLWSCWWSVGPVERVIKFCAGDMDEYLYEELDG